MFRSMFTLASLFCFLSTFSQVQPASVFGDHMVLQQGMPVPVWGRAKAGDKIKIKFNDQLQTIKADKEGRWKVTLTSMKSGGPHQMVIEGKNKIVFEDIYIGEVWLCSGQSNMDMDGKTVLVSSPLVLKPVAVRYGWAKNPPVNLYNEGGLPASPFRTDQD